MRNVTCYGLKYQATCAACSRHRSSWGCQLHRGLEFCSLCCTYEDLWIKTHFLNRRAYEGKRLLVGCPCLILHTFSLSFSPLPYTHTEKPMAEQKLAPNSPYNCVSLFSQLLSAGPYSLHWLPSPGTGGLFVVCSAFLPWEKSPAPVSSLL